MSRADRRRGLGTIIDALVEAVRLNKPDEARWRFERASEQALGVLRVRVVPGAGGGAAVARESLESRWPIPGAAASLVCLPGPQPAVVMSPEVVAQWLGLAELALELERFGQLAARPRRPLTWQLVGRSVGIQHVRSLIAKVARTSFPVLVEGESGVGKEVVARLVHEYGGRARGPFVAVNCAAIVDSLLEAELFGIEDRTATGVRGRRGKFEQADGGTLFLDEIGDLSGAAQAKLLRVLQDFTVERVGGHTSVAVNVRVLAATNRHLADLVAQGRFRQDLFYRLNGVEIHVPPLRDRLDDVPLLAEYVLGRHAEYGRLTLSPEALEALGQYDWPGNVRELERALERAIALSADGTIGLEQLPPAVTREFGHALAPSLRARSTLRQFAARYVRLVLARSGNKREACRVLDISHHTLDSYLRRAEALESQAWTEGTPSPVGPAESS